MRIAATSTEYVRVTITAPDGVDLAGTTPRIAILPAGVRANPAADDWHDATWSGTTALLLVGPDDGVITLTPGDWWVWVAVDPPGAENIVRRAGLLAII